MSTEVTRDRQFSEDELSIGAGEKSDFEEEKASGSDSEDGTWKKKRMMSILSKPQEKDGKTSNKRRRGDSEEDKGNRKKRKDKGEESKESRDGSNSPESGYNRAKEKFDKRSTKQEDSGEGEEDYEDARKKFRERRFNRTDDRKGTPREDRDHRGRRGGREERDNRREERGPRRPQEKENKAPEESEPPPPPKKPRVDDTLSTRTGGAYIPPAKLKMMQEQITDKTSLAYQRIAWEALKKSINGIVNKANITNMEFIIPELLQLNLVRGRGLLARSLLMAQAAAPTFTHVYAALVAVINTKFPQNGDLLLRRLIMNFKKGFRRNDKTLCSSSTRFLAHLVNQQVAHEVLALEILTLLLENPTDDSVEIAVGFLKECGQKLSEVTPRGVHAIFERSRSILHEATIDKRVQYMVEVMFANRKDSFKEYPAIVEGLDLVDESEQYTHMLTLDENYNTEDILNIFKHDSEYVQNEEKYKAIRAEILGEESGSEESGSDDDESGEESEEEAEEAKKMEIQDETETNLTALRRTVYLTVQSSLDFEECAHKMMRMEIKPGQEVEVCLMIIDCCAQLRTYEKFFGLLAQRFCQLKREYVAAYESIFPEQYSTCHRLDTNKLRNVSKMFAHLFFTDAISWTAFHCIHLNEVETTSSSRIFIKILFQELSEYMGLPKLNERFKDKTLQPYFEGLMPRDNPANTRFAINFFTSIGLGGLTEDLREHLTDLQKRIMQQHQAVQTSSESSSSSSSSSSDDSSSSSSSDSSSSDDESGDDGKKKKLKRKSEKKHSKSERGKKKDQQNGRTEKGSVEDPVRKGDRDPDRAERKGITDGDKNRSDVGKRGGSRDGRGRERRSRERRGHSDKDGKSHGEDTMMNGDLDRHKDNRRGDRRSGDRRSGDQEMAKDASRERENAERQHRDGPPLDRRSRKDSDGEKGKNNRDDQRVESSGGRDERDRKRNKDGGQDGIRGEFDDGRRERSLEKGQRGDIKDRGNRHHRSANVASDPRKLADEWTEKEKRMEGSSRRNDNRRDEKRIGQTDQYNGKGKDDKETEHRSKGRMSREKGKADKSDVNFRRRNDPGGDRKRRERRDYSSGSDDSLDRKSADEGRTKRKKDGMKKKSDDRREKGDDSSRDRDSHRGSRESGRERKTVKESSPPRGGEKDRIRKKGKNGRGDRMTEEDDRRSHSRDRTRKEREESLERREREQKQREKAEQDEHERRLRIEEHRREVERLQRKVEELAALKKKQMEEKGMQSSSSSSSSSDSSDDDAEDTRTKSSRGTRKKQSKEKQDGHSSKESESSSSGTSSEEEKGTKNRKESKESDSSSSSSEDEKKPSQGSRERDQKDSEVSRNRRGEKSTRGRELSKSADRKKPQREESSSSGSESGSSSSSSDDENTKQESRKERNEKRLANGRLSDTTKRRRKAESSSEGSSSADEGRNAKKKGGKDVRKRKQQERRRNHSGSGSGENSSSSSSSSSGSSESDSDGEKERKDRRGRTDQGRKQSPERRSKPRKEDIRNRDRKREIRKSYSRSPVRRR